VTAQLAPDEEAALAAHLSICGPCRAEATSLLSVAATSLGSDPGAEPWAAGDDAPPPDLADRIVARVARERRRGGRRWRAAGLAAVAATAALVAAVVLAPSEPAPLEGEPIAFARQAAGVDARATLAGEGDGSLVQLVASGLDPGATYALWLTPPGGGYDARVAAGTFRAGADGEVDVRLPCALAASAVGRVWATTADGRVALDTEEPLRSPRQAGTRSGTRPATRATAR
jgi:hypothetical protein